LQEELILNAKRDLADQIWRGIISPNYIEAFIDNKVTGVNINGVDVISIDVDREPGNLEQIIRGYMNCARTKVIVPEYFYPELQSNAGILSSLMEKTASRKVKGELSKRLYSAQIVTDACRDSGKPIAVAEIANRPSYLAADEAFNWYPGLLGILFSKLTGQDPILFTGVGLDLAYIFNKLRLDRGQKGIFNRDTVSELDKYIPDMEQARRLFLAKGVEQLTQEYSTAGRPGDETPQIVVLYPKAHGIRMADMLVNPHPHLDKAKSIAYKILGPTLDFSVRTYRWKDSLQRLAESGYRFGQPQIISSDGLYRRTISGLAGWQKVSDRKIKV
jgi:hypothetical protein